MHPQRTDQNIFRPARTLGRKFIALWQALILLGGLLVAPHASADICIPAAGGVPYQPGLPDFWSGSASYDDPRWRGAFAYSAGHVKFRALLDPAGNKALVLMWDVTADPGTAVNTAGDLVYVGLHNPSTSRTTVLGFGRNTANVVTAGTVASGDLTVESYVFSGGSWTKPNASTEVPTVVSQARIDTVCTDGAFDTCARWTIRARIPLSSADGGITLPNNFRMWFHAINSFGSMVEDVAWPNGIEATDGVPFPTFPATAGWQVADISGPGASCTQGIVLQNSYISVDNSAFGTGTRLDTTGPNTFHARPVNMSGTNFAADAIQARFRIANWGSAGGGVGATWDDVPGCSAAANTSAVGSGATFDLSCAWTLSAMQACQYRPDLNPGCNDGGAPKDDHQCIYVELSKKGALSATFSPDSAWQNMNFGPASLLKRTATIQVRKISPVPDVYLFVEKMNMPEEVGPNTVFDQEKWRRALSTLQDKELIAQLRNFEVGKVGTKQALILQRAQAQGLIDDAFLEAVMPTYRAHVWHDSGKTRKVAGVERKILAAQPSYGLFVSHDGALHGWEASLSSSEGTLTELSPNFYRLKMNGKESVKVTHEIDALEEPPCKCKCPSCAKVGHEHPQGYPHGEVPPHKHSCGCDIPGKERGGSGLLFVGLLLFIATGIRRKWGAAA